VCRYAHGPPPCFWLPGFFFTPSFTTAALQNYARREKLPIDAVGFDFAPLSGDPLDTAAWPQAPPPAGVYVSGLYLEGCGWDIEKQELKESEPKVLFATAPVLWLQPKRAEGFAAFAHYSCPVYRTAERHGARLAAADAAAAARMSLFAGSAGRLRSQTEALTCCTRAPAQHCTGQPCLPTGVCSRVHVPPFPTLNECCALAVQACSPPRATRPTS
jgi:Dynein heavy chain C-terminal domain